MRSLFLLSAMLLVVAGPAVAGAEEGVKQSAGHRYVVGISGMH